MTSTADLHAFRLEVRQFLQDRLPEDIRAAVRAGQALGKARTVAWNEILATAGWLVPHWPERWGGRGWSAERHLVFAEEMAVGHAPEPNGISFDMIAPVLMRWGSPAQQAAFLPAIASGRQWWCQGFSEPNAGSDLAALTTRARREGDHYVVDGSKIWTSGAQYADWIFCLVRTDSEARAQQGISFLLIDMRSPGITLRPIVGLHGWALFNQVFLDGVRVPVDNRVGQENQGWTVAKSLLEFERLKLARIGENKRRRERLLAIARTADADGQRLADRPWFRQRFAELDVRLRALEANAARFMARQSRGEAVGQEVSMLKLRGSRLIQLWEDLTVDALGLEALPLEAAALHAQPAGGAVPGPAATASSRRFMSRGFTIAGGSSEVQHNILAKQVLAL